MLQIQNPKYLLLFKSNLQINRKCILFYKILNHIIHINNYIEVLPMAIFEYVRQIWSPIIRKDNDMSFTRLTKNISKSVYASLIFIVVFLYYAVSKPEKLTLKMSKSAEHFGQMKIPKFARNKFFNLYSQYYGVKLNELIDPLDSFQSFSQFFTRRVKPRQIIQNPSLLIAPADSKILKISKIEEDQCSIIKGASYAFGQLMTGAPIKFSREEIKKLKKDPENNLYQVIFYLAPGDYHRFHTPCELTIEKSKKIDGALWGVSEKILKKKKRVYEKNGRIVVDTLWSPSNSNKKLYMGLVMVGALNVGRIVVHTKKQFLKGQELGYFNLGSTIVMIFEAKSIANWHKKEGDKIRYGDILCQAL